MATKDERADMKLLFTQKVKQNHTHTGYAVTIGQQKAPKDNLFAVQDARCICHSNTIKALAAAAPKERDHGIRSFARVKYSAQSPAPSPFHTIMCM